MRNNVKNNETKLPPLGINIKFGWWLVGLAMVVGLIYAFGATISTIASIYIGYKLLKLILRVFGLLISLFIFIVFVATVITIISLIVF